MVKPDPAIVALRQALEQRLDAMADEARSGSCSRCRPTQPPMSSSARTSAPTSSRTCTPASRPSTPTARSPGGSAVVRPHAARRAKRVSVTEFVQAFYVGERVLWDTALGLATTKRHAGRRLCSHHTSRAISRLRPRCAEVYLETQEQLAATGERIRRDLLEDLLAGRELDRVRLNAARAAGLVDESSVVVISATRPDAQRRTVPARGRGGAGSRDRRPDAPACGRPPDEIAVVVPAAEAPRTRSRRGSSRSSSTRRRRAAAGPRISTAVNGALPRSPTPSRVEHDRIVCGSAPRVVALSELSAFESLTLRADPTTGRLIPRAVHEFVAQDLPEGRPLSPRSANTSPATSTRAAPPPTSTST